MKVNMAPTFFDSVERMINRQKWYWKTWDFLRYDMPRFFRNLWLFRKDLYNYRWYGGQHAVLPFMKTTLLDMASKIDERGMEVEKSKDKKVAKMYRAAFLMERFIEDDFIEIAEKELGDLISNGFDFEAVPDKPGYSRLVDKETPEEKEINESKKVQTYIKKKINKVNDMEEVKNLSETIEQELTSEFILRENENAKFVGKTNLKNLIFENEGKQIKVSPKGEIL